MQPAKPIKLGAGKMSDSEGETTKVPRKCVQKESRNTASNLLRIFLKHLIQLRSYSQLVGLIATRLQLEFTP
jgi:hypothetical protein